MTRTSKPSRFARLGGLALLPLVLAGCGGPGAAVEAPAPTATPSKEIHWVRSSAEHRAIFLQTYRDGSDYLRERASALQPGRWGVILDADETVLDNSEYQRRIDARGESFSNDTWNAWVREAAAPALPGAVDFIETVKELGGRVFIVTNRDEAVCGPTRENLTELGVDYDAVLCRAEGESGKEGRFAAVAEGRTGTGAPPVEVIAWFGDNIHDFPGGMQEWREGSPPELANFGVRWFIFPNPMYGSWEN